MAIAANMHIPYKIEIGEDDVRDLHAEDHFGKGKCAVTIIHTHARAHTHTHPHRNFSFICKFHFQSSKSSHYDRRGCVCMPVCNNIVVYPIVVVVNESVVSLCCSNYHYSTNER